VISLTLSEALGSSQYATVSDTCQVAIAFSIYIFYTKGSSDHNLAVTERWGTICKHDFRYGKFNRGRYHWRWQVPYDLQPRVDIDKMARATISIEKGQVFTEAQNLQMAEPRCLSFTSAQ
jgi:hypothetical protein